jgi:hypothetical protein
MRTERLLERIWRPSWVRREGLVVTDIVAVYPAPPSWRGDHRGRAIAEGVDRAGGISIPHRCHDASKPQRERARQGRGGACQAAGGIDLRGLGQAHPLETLRYRNPMTKKGFAGPAEALARWKDHTLVSRAVAGSIMVGRRDTRRSAGRGVQALAIRGSAS